jgi:hypothetical protein
MPEDDDRSGTGRNRGTFTNGQSVSRSPPHPIPLPRRGEGITGRSPPRLPPHPIPVPWGTAPEGRGDNRSFSSSLAPHPIPVPWGTPPKRARGETGRSPPPLPLSLAGGLGHSPQRGEGTRLFLADASGWCGSHTSLRNPAARIPTRSVSEAPGHPLISGSVDASVVASDCCPGGSRSPSTDQL